MFGTCCGTHLEVQDRSWEPRGVVDELGDPQGGLGRVGRTTKRSGTGWCAHLEVRDGSGNSL